MNDDDVPRPPGEPSNNDDGVSDLTHGIVTPRSGTASRTPEAPNAALGFVGLLLVPYRKYLLAAFLVGLVIVAVIKLA